jgi:hypothetical protein
MPSRHPTLFHTAPHRGYAWLLSQQRSLSKKVSSKKVIDFAPSSSRAGLVNYCLTLLDDVKVVTRVTLHHHLSVSVSAGMSVNGQGKSAWTVVSYMHVYAPVCVCACLCLCVCVCVCLCVSVRVCVSSHL